MSYPPWLLKAQRIVTSPLTSKWCLLPYPNHPKGCPMFGKKSICPPGAPFIDELLDLSYPIYIVFSEFDLESHVQNMKTNHPGWTDRQCRCVFYWQSKSRKQLRDRIKMARFLVQAHKSVICPEGSGVNVYATCRLAGLELEKIRYLKTCRHVALLGTGF